MNALQQIAISKAVKDTKAKAARKELTVGTHDIDMTVHISGTVVVKEDTMQKATASVLSEDNLLLILKAAGVTRKAAMNAIESVASDYLVGWTGTEADKKRAANARKEALYSYDPDGSMKNIFSDIKDRLPKIKRSGSVSFKGSVDEVSSNVEENCDNVVAINA